MLLVVGVTVVACVTAVACIQTVAGILLQKTVQIRDQFFLYMEPVQKVHFLSMQLYSAARHCSAVMP
jgi:hypothetical protein